MPSLLPFFCRIESFSPLSDFFAKGGAKNPRANNLMVVPIKQDLQHPANASLRPALQRRQISLRRIKSYALRLPSESLLREILLREPDKIDALEFVVKVPVWLYLLEKENEIKSFSAAQVPDTEKRLAPAGVMQ
jgi:hypothetical protein